MKPIPLPKLFKSLPEEIFWEPKRLIRADWVGHIPFLYYLMTELQPSLYVELGVFHGDSYCAACQVVEAKKLPTRLVGIDCWEGDIHTKIIYNEQVLEDLKHHHDPLYSTFSTLERGYFSDKLPLFRDEEIELLHIDGEHTYEAVTRDYKEWLPKVSKNRGIILFHDTNVLGREEFGVWRLWEELMQQGHSGIRFPHCNGLGVFLMGALDAYPESIRSMVEQEQAGDHEWKALFATLGTRFEEAAHRRLEREAAHQRMEKEIAHQRVELETHFRQCLEQELMNAIAPLQNEMEKLQGKINTQRERIDRLVSEKNRAKEKVKTMRLQTKSLWLPKLLRPLLKLEARLRRKKYQE